MKLSTEHQLRLSAMIDKVMLDYRELQQSDDLTSLHKFYQDKCVNTGKDWKKLLSWSMLYYTPFTIREKWFREVYEYANDDHIYTALKQSMKEYLP